MLVKSPEILKSWQLKGSHTDFTEANEAPLGELQTGAPLNNPQQHQVKAQHELNAILSICPDGEGGDSSCSS